MRADYGLQRLYVAEVPPAGVEFTPDKPALHYLLHVLRLQKGQDIVLFDGQSGEWRAQCVDLGKKSLRLRVEAQTRRQTPPGRDLVYCFAPLKGARLDYMVQKAVEMGVTCLQPVLTQHTQIHRLNSARLAANIIEAAEQCGLLSLAATAAPLPLAALVQDWRQQWGEDARLVFADEAQIIQDRGEQASDAAGAKLAGAGAQAMAARLAAAHNPLPMLRQLAAKGSGQKAGGTAGQNRPIAPAVKERAAEAAEKRPIQTEADRQSGLAAPRAKRPKASQQAAKIDSAPAAAGQESEAMRQEPAALPALGLLIGPEGGFSAAERRLLYAQDFVTAIPLGPRILRADTAATAALALIQATLGDW